MSVAKLRDVELFYETIGDGPPILTLHGNGLDHAYLRPWHDALSKTHRVIYFDQRGHGRSTRSKELSEATLHGDMLALLDELGEPRVCVFGHSYGSWFALAFALRYPERVESLVLCGTAPAFDYADAVVAGAMARDPACAASLLSALQNGVATSDELRDTWQRILPLYFHGPARPELFANTLFSVDGFNAFNAQLPGVNFLDALPRLDIPVLALAGESDFITPPAQARRLAALAPRATAVEIADAGHFPFVEQPAAYIAALENWFTNNPR